MHWPDWSGWPYLLLGLGLLAVALSAWRPTPAGVWHDDGVYMMVGKALAQGEGLHYLGVVGTPPAPKFPPLYSGLLGMLWFVFGSLGAVTLVAELLNLVLVAGAGVLFAWSLETHGRLPRSAAFAAAVLAFSSADLLRFALVPLSEPLFLVLLMGVMASWEAGRSGRGWLPWLTAGLLALLILTRTAGVAAVAGVGLALILRASVLRSLAILTPAIVVMAAWGVWAARKAAEIPEGLRDVLGPYVGWLVAQVGGAPVAFAGRLPAHVEQVGSRVAALLLPGLSGVWLWLAFVPIVALAVVGVRRLHRDFPAFTWTAGAYLGLLVVWPYVDRRLVAPLHPFGVGFIIAGALELAERVKGTRATRAVAAVALLWMGGYTVMTASRIADGWPVAAYRLRADALATGLEVLSQAAPEGAVVGAPELWAALALHGGWTVIPSALFAPAATVSERPVWGTPEEQLALWRSTGVDHLLLERGGQIHGEALNAKELACPGSVNILARMPPQMVVHVRWQDCPGGP